MAPLPELWRETIKYFKRFFAAIAIVGITPVVVFYGYFAYLFLSSAFPARSIAVERFERGGVFQFPRTAGDLYFRIAMGSPLDEGGSALMFSAASDEIEGLLNTKPHGTDWQVLDKTFHCDCIQCIRYSRPVDIPAGSVFWRHDRGNYDNVMMAVNAETKQVYWCARDT